MKKLLANMVIGALALAMVAPWAWLLAIWPAMKLFIGWPQSPVANEHEAVAYVWALPLWSLMCFFAIPVVSALSE